jgi:tetratricopeptide (TPR) repeat protein
LGPVDAKELGLLINALKIKDSGFFLVEVQDNQVRDDLVLKIKVALGRVEKRTAIIDFLLMENKSIPAFVSEQVRATSHTQVFFIKNLETKAGKFPVNFLRQLNMARESIYALKKNFVFFVYPKFNRLLMIFARDFFSWIPQRYVFEKGYMEPREFARSIRMEERARFKGDRDRKYLIELIDIYEKQLESAPKDITFRIENIIGPLADLYHEIGDFQKEIPLRVNIVEFYKNSYEAHARALNNLGNAYLYIPTGDRGENLKKAIESYREALKIYTPDAFPVEYAGTINNLGSVYRDLPTGDRGENLKRAIEAYREALKIRTLDAFPKDYAETMSNMGIAYSNLPTGDRGENLKRAIEAYRVALKIRTRDAFPVDYAETMNNLGNAYCELPTGDKGENLAKAIESYREALKIYTIDAFPVYYAATMNNLGTAYFKLSTGDRGENLQNGIESYRESVKIYTLDAFPIEYAGIMNNLGAAYMNLPTGDNEENLKRALEYYREALKVYAIDAFPVGYATTMKNMGIAYSKLLYGDKVENINKAIYAFKEALKVFTVNAFPHDFKKVKPLLDGVEEELDKLSKG